MMLKLFGQWSMRPVFIFKILNLIFLFQNCSGFETYNSSDFSSQGVFDYEVVNSTVFASKCLHCHNHTIAGGGVYFTSYEDLMNSEVIVPFSFEESLLYQAVESGDMPPDGVLTEQEKSLIAKWIRFGALGSAESLSRK